MRSTVIVAVLLLFGCSSNMGIVSDAIEGGPGQDISVAVAGLESSDLGRGFRGRRDYVMQVEVSNNSDHAVTVTRIIIRPTSMGQAFRIDDANATFNEMIDPGEDHIFDVRLQGTLERDFRPEERRTVSFRVTVSLSNGERYFYTFEGPVRL
jgi:hypothetical protein